MNRYYQKGACPDSGCGEQPAAEKPRTTPAMAFVPPQVFDAVYEPEAGFPRGTIFPDLDKPFLAVGGKTCGLQ